MGSGSSTTRFSIHNSGNNKRTTLLKELSHIRFPSLMRLVLWENALTSIEGIGRISMPQVGEIFLCTTVVRQTGTRSGGWVRWGKHTGPPFSSSPSVTVFVRSDQNCSFDECTLCEGCMPKLKQLYLHYSGIRSADTCSVAKLETESLNMLREHHFM